MWHVKKIRKTEIVFVTIIEKFSARMGQMQYNKLWDIEAQSVSISISTSVNVSRKVDFAKKFTFKTFKQFCSLNTTRIYASNDI